VWEVRVSDSQDRLVSVARLTFAVVDLPGKAA
jgi:acyl-coenzyme A thioesterase PaaI-like protein